MEEIRQVEAMATRGRRELASRHSGRWQPHWPNINLTIRVHIPSILCRILHDWENYTVHGLPFCPTGRNRPNYDKLSWVSLGNCVERQPSSSLLRETTSLSFLTFPHSRGHFMLAIPFRTRRFRCPTVWLPRNYDPTQTDDLLWRE